MRVSSTECNCLEAQVSQRSHLKHDSNSCTAERFTTFVNKDFSAELLQYFNKESYLFDSMLFTSKNIIFSWNYSVFDIYNGRLYFHLCLNLACFCNLLFLSHRPFCKYQFYLQFIYVHITLCQPTASSHVTFISKRGLFLSGMSINVLAIE